MAKETVIEEARNDGGRLIAAYGKNYFLKVFPASSIGYTKWSLVKIGSSGKEHLDFYLPYEEMRIFCEEVESGLCGKKITADKGNRYPAAYQFVGGKDGSRKLNIGASSKAGYVAVNVTNGKEHGLMAISFHALRTLSFNFRLMTGLIPVTKGYYSDLKTALIEGEKKSEEYHKDIPDEDLDLDTDEDVEEEEPTEKAEPKKAEKPKEAPKAEKPKTAPKAVNKPVTAPAAGDSNPAKILTGTVSMAVKSEIKKSKNGFSFAGKFVKDDGTEGDTDYTVTIPANAEISKDDFIALRDQAKESLGGDTPLCVRFKYQMRKGEKELTFISFE